MAGERLPKTTTDQALEHAGKLVISTLVTAGAGYINPAAGAVMLVETGRQFILTKKYVSAAIKEAKLKQP